MGHAAWLIHDIHVYHFKNGKTILKTNIYESIKLFSDLVSTEKESLVHVNFSFLT